MLNRRGQENTEHWFSIWGHEIISGDRQMVVEKTRLGQNPGFSTGAYNVQLGSWVNIAASWGPLRGGGQLNNVS